MKRILFLTGIGLILIYVVLIVGISFYPASFSFLESAICPPGMTFDEETAKRNRGRRNSYIKCSNQNGETVNVTGRLLLTGLVPFSIGLLFILFSVRRKNSFQSAPRDDSAAQNREATRVKLEYKGD